MFNNKILKICLNKPITKKQNEELTVEKNIEISFNFVNKEIRIVLDFKYKNNDSSCIHYYKGILLNNNEILSLNLNGINKVNNENFDINKFLIKKINNKTNILILKEYFNKVLTNDLLQEYNDSYKTTYIAVTASRSKKPIPIVVDGKLQCYDPYEIQNTVINILQNIAKPNIDGKFDFGLDIELVYLNILANIPIEMCKILYLDQLSDCKFLKQDNIFLQPTFSGGHTTLSVSNKFILDSQNNIDIGSLNSKYNFQTKIGKGCCGYFVSSYAIEILNNFDKYKPLFKIESIEKLKENRNLLEVLVELNLNAIIQVSKLIDDESIINLKKQSKTDVEIKINDTTSYWIVNDCEKSNCINISELVLYLDDILNLKLSKTLASQIEIQKKRNIANGAREYKDSRTYGELHSSQLQPDTEQIKPIIGEHTKKLQERRSNSTSRSSSRSSRGQ